MFRSVVSKRPISSVHAELSPARAARTSSTSLQSMAGGRLGTASPLGQAAAAEDGWACGPPWSG